MFRSMFLQVYPTVCVKVSYPSVCQSDHLAPSTCFLSVFCWRFVRYTVHLATEFSVSTFSFHVRVAAIPAKLPAFPPVILHALQPFNEIFFYSCILQTNKLGFFLATKEKEGDRSKVRKGRGRGVPRGDAQDARASPPPPLCIPPYPPVHPPLQPERLVMRRGGGRSAKNVHPPRQNPRYAPGSRVCEVVDIPDDINYTILDNFLCTYIFISLYIIDLLKIFARGFESLHNRCENWMDFSRKIR